MLTQSLDARDAVTGDSSLFRTAGVRQFADVGTLRKSGIAVRLVAAGFGKLDEGVHCRDALGVAVPLPERQGPDERPFIVTLADLSMGGLWEAYTSRCVQFHFPKPILKEIAAENGYIPVVSLAGRPSLRVLDDTFRRLAAALEPALLYPHDASPLFISSVMRAAAIHLIARFGQKRAPVQRGGLASWQQKRACQMLVTNLDGGISLTEIAAACRLSIRQFSRAFTQSMGMPPQRWLIKHRVESAKALLRSTPLSLADVATTVGFADQSHLTRVFSKWTGQSPGAWRRANALGPQ
ncbi:helix-turn-helix domain-containing protein [Rhizobium mesoamericanum]|uniref:helix-turn-helix domain-containing protein n=1 Tax=Rhizobium mesoamericanum TaxID=1079800 RepID=UPI00138B066A|nr:AraC family transcriptional regulator [Rhizobium mesoamericanum]